MLWVLRIILSISLHGNCYDERTDTVSPWHHYNILSLCILQRYLWNEDILRRKRWQLSYSCPPKSNTKNIDWFLILIPVPWAYLHLYSSTIFSKWKVNTLSQSDCGNSNQVLVSASLGTHPTILGQLDKMAHSHSLLPSHWSISAPSSPLIGQEETIEPIVTLTITLLNNCMVSKIWGGVRRREICFILSEIRSVCLIQWATNILGISLLIF